MFLLLLLLVAFFAVTIAKWRSFCNTIYESKKLRLTYDELKKSVLDDPNSWIINYGRLTFLGGIHNNYDVVLSYKDYLLFLLNYRKWEIDYASKNRRKFESMMKSKQK